MIFQSTRVRSSVRVLKLALSRWLSFGLLLGLLPLVGCSHAWVVRHDTQGGVIGYRGFSDNNEAMQAVVKLVHCPEGHDGISDELKESTYQYTSYRPVTTTGYTRDNYGYAKRQDYTTQVPVTETGVKSWREFTYKCRSSSIKATLIPGAKKAPAKAE